MNRLFVGRHGRVNRSGNFEDHEMPLIEDGKADARAMAGRLRSEGLNPQSIIMAGLTLRTQDTARIIKEELHIPTLVRSEFVGKVGERPQPVEDLRGFIGDLLVTCEVDHQDSDVVVVTHLPLVTAVAGRKPVDGGIYEVPQGWQNPKYVPGFEMMLQAPEMW
jgi:phosphohistidine phosphatase SixA